MTTNLAFPTLLETFFTDRLLRQKQASPHTIASYRDTCSLLWRFTHKRLGKAPSALTLGDLDAPLISTFLDDLEQQRGTSARSRTVRLAAIHAFFHYAALLVPSHSGLIQRVLAIPSKRYDRTPIALLTDTEIDVLLAAPDQHTWAGRREQHVAAGRRPDWPARLRADRALLAGRRLRHRGSRILARQGSQDAVSPTPQRRDHRVTRVAAGTARSPRRARVS